MAILFYTFTNEGQFDGSQFSRIFAHERIWRTLGNSVVLGIFVIIGTTIIALPMAFIRTKTSLYQYEWLDIVLTIPFMTPLILVLWAGFCLCSTMVFTAAYSTCCWDDRFLLFLIWHGNDHELTPVSVLYLMLKIHCFE